MRHRSSTPKLARANNPATALDQAIAKSAGSEMRSSHWSDDAMVKRLQAEPWWLVIAKAEKRLGRVPPTISK
jgi:hypothetical protein